MLRVHSQDVVVGGGISRVCAAPNRQANDISTLRRQAGFVRLRDDRHRATGPPLGAAMTHVPRIDAHGDRAKRG